MCIFHIGVSKTARFRGFYYTKHMILCLSHLAQKPKFDNNSLKIRKNYYNINHMYNVM